MAQRNPLFNISRLIDESKGEEVSVETSFAEDMKRCIEKLNTSSGKPSTSYKPSSLSCIRNMYYQCVGADPDPSPVSADMVGIGESGTDRHLRIQTYISAMRSFGIDCDYVDVAEYIQTHEIPDLEVVGKKGFETKLHNTKYNITFLVDGIIYYKGEYYILEIKTESSYKWRDRCSVDESHHPQAFTYSACLKIDKVMFIYENRDCCAKKYYVLVVHDSDRQSVFDKITTCESYVKSSIVPSKPEDVSKKTCQYCSYRTLCRKDGR